MKIKIYPKKKAVKVYCRKKELQLSFEILKKLGMKNKN